MGISNRRWNTIIKQMMVIPVDTAAADCWGYEPPEAPQRVKPEQTCKSLSKILKMAIAVPGINAPWSARAAAKYIRNFVPLEKDWNQIGAQKRFPFEIPPDMAR